MKSESHQKGSEIMDEKPEKINHQQNRKRKKHKLRTAAYCRVSTDYESQEDSFKLQVKYFEKRIKSNPNWEYVGVYSDRGISGTNAKNRPGFQKMIKDAEDGKIDLILVKSVSRFSRSLRDFVKYVLLLHSRGVELRFEKEKLSTADPSAFLVFGILATIAQSESESISTNIRWRIQNRFSQGRYTLGNRYLGYSTTSEGKIVINEDAWIIRMAFKLFIEGKSYYEIADEINKAGGHNIKGEKVTNRQVWSWVRNEVYVGDKLLQKRPPKNYLTHKPDQNVEYTSYYVKDGHPGIIDRETWNAAQKRAARLKKNRYPRRDSAKGYKVHYLTNMVFCGNCGEPYRRRLIITSKRRYMVWGCCERTKGKNGNGCKNRNIKENDILKAISEELGWEWKGAESFDKDEFKKKVERIVVYDDHLEIIKKGNS